MNNKKQFDNKTEKKPFDKKKYRLQKYSKKFRIQQWEDKRKKVVLRNYYKSLKEDESSRINKTPEEQKYESDNTVKSSDNSSAKGTVKDITTNNQLTESKFSSLNKSKQNRSKPYHKALQEFQRIKEEGELLKKKKIEKAEAMQEYKKKKIEKYKKLNQKTKKGQPVMKGRLEMLLEKIQDSIK